MFVFHLIILGDNAGTAKSTIFDDAKTFFLSMYFSGISLQEATVKKCVVDQYGINCLRLDLIQYFITIGEN